MKSITLKENKDFRRLYYRGKSDAAPCLVTYVMKSRLGKTRVGITSGKKIGNAVKRNRARRLIRAAFTEYEDRLNGDYDIVFVARTKTAQVKMQEVQRQMEDQLKKLGVLN
ncbi:MAG: ribonuclease P protein component [Eubacterium sp.]|nr:ribonuclease P protein component [Eubacterium sp.]MDE6155257.1 ribonuclease P protein component [Eubacterium sp.]MDE6470027.1 ribonuclease P protein component [Eubacterium sp.]MDE6766899.1 ribonuclease P protein component [Eubacterium sp.]